MEAELPSNSQTARTAVSIFIFLCVPLSIWDGMYVPGKIFVAQDPVATASNLLAHESMFRLAIATHLAGTVLFIIMMLLFYRIFRPVDGNLARFMMLPILAQLPIIIILELAQYMALMILKGDPRPSFDVAQQQEAAYVLLRMFRFGAGAGIGKFVFGLSFIPFGLLTIRSGFAPRIIGILLIIGGIGYVADCFIAILLQRADYVVVRSYLMYTTLAYVAAFLWFLIKGMREADGPGRI